MSPKLSLIVLQREPIFPLEVCPIFFVAYMDELDATVAMERIYRMSVKDPKSESRWFFLFYFWPI